MRYPATCTKKLIIKTEKADKIWVPLYTDCVYESAMGALGYFWKREDAAKCLRKHIRLTIKAQREYDPKLEYLHHKKWQLKQKCVK